MIKYRLLDTVDWEALDGMSVQVQVSKHGITLLGLKTRLPIPMAQVVIPRAKPRGAGNGQPVDDESVQPDFVTHQGGDDA